MNVLKPVSMNSLYVTCNPWKSFDDSLPIVGGSTQLNIQFGMDLTYILLPCLIRRKLFDKHVTKGNAALSELKKKTN